MNNVRTDSKSRRCIVKDCQNYGRHRFPIDETLKAQWLQAIQHLKPKLTVGKSSICSAHFKETDFHFATNPLWRFAPDIAPRRLKRTAVPSIFPWSKIIEEESKPSVTPVSQESLTVNISNIKYTYARILPMKFVEEQPYLEIEPCESRADPLRETTESEENQTTVQSEELHMTLKMEIEDEITDQCSDDMAVPGHFKFGAATSAYQVEGGWNTADKSESIWDRHVRLPGRIRDGSTGDVACDSYHLWERDVEIAKEMGLQFYRFSINWTRLLPKAFPTVISEDGKRYYNNLIDALIKNNIEPMITLYHWDLPQRLQDLGGWTNPLIADWFADYARVAFSLFGDRVKTWFTINEPISICDLAYKLGVLAPALVDPDVANYLATKHVLLAHAKAYRLYHEEFKFGGKVSINMQAVWLEPASNSAEDVKLADLTREYMLERYTHPIFSKEGGWPSALEKLVEENSKKEGYARSRLPAFTQEEIELVRGTYDFFSLNFYTSRVVKRIEGAGELKGLRLIFEEVGSFLDRRPEWKPAFEGAWLYRTPTALRKQLAWLKRYNPKIEVMITENGFPTHSTGASDLNDDERVQYFKEHLEQVFLAIKEDDVNVTGYTAWSLMDNFEWFEGYLSRFGLYEVDFSDPNRTRTPKKSAKYYAQVIKNRSLDVTV